MYASRQGETADRCRGVPKLTPDEKPTNMADEQSVKSKLETILKRAKLTPREKEAFEDMWDKLHRYKRVTHKQKYWIEKVYFAQHLDGSPKFLGSPDPKAKPKVGYINYPGVTEVVMATNFEMFRKVCPGIKPGSNQYQKVRSFFEKGGEILKIKPVEKSD